MIAVFFLLPIFIYMLSVIKILRNDVFYTLSLTMSQVRLTGLMESYSP